MINSDPIRGLNSDEVIASRRAYGNNKVENNDDRVFWKLVKGITLEPMFLLLVAAALLYFILKQYQEGFIMLGAILLVSGISFYQDYRSRNAVAALKKLSGSQATVIRSGEMVKLPAEDIVAGDILQLTEGEIVAADGEIIHANDFSLNESILTGEAFPVVKPSPESDRVFKGTLVNSGSGLVRVLAVGKETMFGKIGSSLQAIAIPRTPLQMQIRGLVRHMLWAGAAAFVLVVGFNFQQNGNLLLSFMQGLTLAMSILPEEIPVAFSTFQAIGAYRMLREGLVVKEPQYVETLGSATVICTDKTGTLTQNRMTIEFIYDAETDSGIHVEPGAALPLHLVEMAMWSSETDPFDPMEKAIHALYGSECLSDKRPHYKQIHEYPIGGQPPMMTHIFQNETGDTLIAAKGAPEALLRHSRLSDERKAALEEKARELAKQGFRVLAVGESEWHESQWPVSQEEFSFHILGLIAFYDPPKPQMRDTINELQEAGISVKMITGDYAETALSIASAVGIDYRQNILTGQEVVRLDEKALQRQVRETSIFARMFPEAKLRVINALKENGEVVAMTGDGVNDGPALRAAHIGIAMGRRGSEVAREAAAIILTDDNLQHMTTAVAQGRRIYDNLKKAVQYIVSIHIPIILVVVLPLLLQWPVHHIFSPVHVIFLELIMGPTCSIVFENEPMEPGTMQRPPRKMTQTFLSWNQFSISLVQGLAITAACLGIGYYYLHEKAGEDQIRTAIFITLLFSNIFLTLVNRSFRYSLFTTLHYRNPRIPQIIAASLLFVATLLWIPWMRQLFELSKPSFSQLIAFLLVGLAATIWIEAWKFLKRMRYSMSTRHTAG